MTNDHAGLNRRALLCALPAGALPLVLPESRQLTSLERVAFHAQALKDALDAHVSEPGSRWCVIMAGRAGDACQLSDFKRFDRGASRAIGEKCTLILPEDWM